jgi:hypothetical protein
MTYLETTAHFYAEAAETPQVGLCCVSTPPLQLPGLKIPEIMQQMNYGCGSTVHPTELFGEPTVLYSVLEAELRRFSLLISVVSWEA